MKKIVKPSILLLLFSVLLLVSCNPSTVNVKVETAIPVSENIEASPQAQPEKTAMPTQTIPTQQEENKPAEEKIAEPTAEPTTDSLPVFPNREKLTYFDVLPDYVDLPEFFQQNFLRIYEAARYSDHYTLRVLYNGYVNPRDQDYLAITLTVADEGFFQPEKYSGVYVNVIKQDFPSLGESSAVLCASRQFAWVLDGPYYLEVALVGGGDGLFTPEMVYGITEKFYHSLPENLPSPAEFEIIFPEQSVENSYPYLQDTYFGNYSIQGDSQRIATDLYWDTWLEYTAAYPIREVMFGFYDTETERYTYQRYKQSGFQDYLNMSHNWLYYDNLYTAFDLMPAPGFYNFSFWVEQSRIFETPIEIFVRDDH